ncbi:MAG: hypothetical protein LBV12_06340 [Puniceicoccales bacterium]|jgi:hypothetical protein|nr:hypothetical protein [Puniceicoccales bacterium]
MPQLALIYDTETGELSAPPDFMLPLELVGTRTGTTDAEGNVEFSLLIDPETGMFNQELIPDVTSEIRASVAILTSNVTALGQRVTTVEALALSPLYRQAILAAPGASATNRFATLNDLVSQGQIVEATETVSGVVKYAATLDVQSGSGTGVVRAKDLLVRAIRDAGSSGYGALFIGHLGIPSGVHGARSIWIAPPSSPGTCEGVNAINIGYWSFVDGAYSIGIGSDTRVYGMGSVALGPSAYALNDYTLVLGRNARADGLFSSAIGANAKATQPYSMLIGVFDPSKDPSGTSTSTDTTAAGGGGGTGLIGGLTINGEVGTVAMTVRVSDTPMIPVSKATGTEAAGELNLGQACMRVNTSFTQLFWEMNANGTLKSAPLYF